MQDIDILTFLVDIRHSVGVAIAQLPGGNYIKTIIKVSSFGLAVYAFVYLVEKYHGVRTKGYQTINFVHDILYWFYYRTGIGALISMSIVLLILGPILPLLENDILSRQPMFLQVIIWIGLGDLTSYWIHRLQHANRFLWAFHTTHHAQEHLTFATGLRFHPVDHLFMNMARIIPVTLLGVSPLTWLPLYIIIEISSLIEHTQIPWKLGPLYRLFATPHFHSFHHSVNPNHYDKNFGGFLSVWDYIFGTAVTADQPAKVLGLNGTKNRTFLSSLYEPFEMIFANGNQLKGSTSEHRRKQT